LTPHLPNEHWIFELYHGPNFTWGCEDAYGDSGSPAHLATGPSSAGWSGAERLGSRARDLAGVFAEVEITFFKGFPVMAQ